MPRRASLPEGKSLFFRRTVEDPEQDVQAATPAPEPSPVQPDRFADDPEEPAETRPAARPVGTGSSTRQSAIFLEERHLDWLEDKCREARQRGGRAIRKALIIRALLDVAMESPVDLTALRKEEDLVDRIRRGVRGT